MTAGADTKAEPVELGDLASPVEAMVRAEFDSGYTAVVVRGPRGYGKSWLLQRLARPANDDAGTSQTRAVLLELRRLRQLLNRASASADWAGLAHAQKADRLLAALAAAQSSAEPAAIKEDDFYIGFGTYVAACLQLLPTWIKLLQSKLSSCKEDLTDLMSDALSACPDQPLLLLMNDCDSALEQPARDGFFLLLRSWIDAGSRSRVWSQLRMVLTVRTATAYLVKTTYASPFNVSANVEIPPLSLQQATELAIQLGFTATPAFQDELKRMLVWVGGMPALVLAMLRASRQTAAGQQLDLQRAEVFAPFLNEILGTLSENPQLVRALAALDTKPLERTEERVALDAMGLIQRSSTGWRVHVPLYQQLIKGILSTESFAFAQLAAFLGVGRKDATPDVKTPVPGEGDAPQFPRRATATALAALSRFQVGGALRGHALYIRRQADEELFSRLSQGQLCYVLAPRQIGKTSLMVRTYQRLQDAGRRCAVVDFTALGASGVQTWYVSLCRRISSELGLPDPEERQRSALAGAEAASYFDEFLRRDVLGKIQGEIVIFIDEIDYARSLPFKIDNFFLILRSFYQLRATDLERTRLTFCLLGVISPAELVSDPAITPFNIGASITLQDFSRAELDVLLPAMTHIDAPAAKLLDEVYGWTAGHPYMTLCVLHDFQQQGNSSAPIAERVAAAVRQRFLLRGAQEDSNLNYAERRLKDPRRTKPELMALLYLYRDIYYGQVSVDPSSTRQIDLLMCGLVARHTTTDGQLRLRVRNRIFAEVFSIKWIVEQLHDRPFAENLVEWLANKRKPKFLLNTKKLEEARSWARGRSDLTFEESEYLSASLQLRDLRSQRRLQVAFLLVIVVMCVATVGFFVNLHRAAKVEKELLAAEQAKERAEGNERRSQEVLLAAEQRAKETEDAQERTTRRLAQLEDLVENFLQRTDAINRQECEWVFQAREYNLRNKQLLQEIEIVDLKLKRTQSKDMSLLPATYKGNADTFFAELEKDLNDQRGELKKVQNKFEHQKKPIDELKSRLKAELTNVGYKELNPEVRICQEVLDDPNSPIKLTSPLKKPSSFLKKYTKLYDPNECVKQDHLKQIFRELKKWLTAQCPLSVDPKTGQPEERRVFIEFYVNQLNQIAEPKSTQPHDFSACVAKQINKRIISELKPGSSCRLTNFSIDEPSATLPSQRIPPLRP